MDHVRLLIQALTVETDHLHCVARAWSNSCNSSKWSTITLCLGCDLLGSSLNLFWNTANVFVYRDPYLGVQGLEIMSSCWEETALIHPSCSPSQTSASPSLDQVRSNLLSLHTQSDWDLMFLLSVPCSSHEDWLWEHSSEDGVQRELCQPGVFQLQAAGQPGVTDHQTQQCGGFLLQQLIPSGSDASFDNRHF